MADWLQDIAINTLWYHSDATVTPTGQGTNGDSISGHVNGAVAVNTADGKMWVRTSGNWTEISSTASSSGGDMTGVDITGGAGITVSQANIESGNYTATVYITDAEVTFAKMQNVAANSILGRNANSSGVLSEIALADREILIGDGTGFTAAALSGDVTMTNAGVVTITNSAVTLANMANIAGNRVIGRAVGAAGPPQAVTIFDENDMASDSAVALATQQSIKYYVDNNIGDITGVTAGTGLSGGGTVGTVTLNVSGLTITELAAASLQISSESFADNDTTLMTSAAIQDKILAYGYGTGNGTVTSVTIGTGLSGSSPITTTGTITLGSHTHQGSGSAGGTLDTAALAAGVLSLARGGTGQDSAAAAFAALAPTTTAGDIIYQGESTDTRLAAGTETHVLTMGATYPEWAVSSTTNIVATANATNADQFIAFLDNSSSTAQQILYDTGLTYNPSSNNITTTTFTGALTGNADSSTVATTVTITDNEDTNENNAVIFTAGGDVDGGNLGLESNGTLTYNPSTGILTATSFTGLFALANGVGQLAIAKGGTGQATAAAAFAALSPLITRGDILYRNASTSTRLPKGTQGHVLTQGAADPYWSTAGTGTVTSVAAGAGLAGTTITTAGTLTLAAHNHESGTTAGGTLSTSAFDAGQLPVARGGTGNGTFSNKAVLTTQDSGTEVALSSVMDGHGELLIGGEANGPTVGTLSGGTGISIVNAENSITVNLDVASVVTLTASQSLSNKTLTSAVLNTSISGTAILDEDNMSSDSALKLATQQSIKAYVDSSGGSGTVNSGTAYRFPFYMANGTTIGDTITLNTVTSTSPITWVPAPGGGNPVVTTLSLTATHVYIDSTLNVRNIQIGASGNQNSVDIGESSRWFNDVYSEDFHMSRAVSGNNRSVALTASSTLGANYTITFPAAAPTDSGKVLSTTGSSPFSTLEWTDAASGGLPVYTNVLQGSLLAESGQSGFEVPYWTNKSDNTGSRLMWNPSVPLYNWTYLRIEGAGATKNTGILLYSYSAGISNAYTSAPFILFNKSHTNTLGDNVETVSGEHLGYLRFEGFNSNDTTAVGGEMRVVQGGSAGSSYIDTDIIFKASNVTTGLWNYHLTLNRYGNIGIRSGGNATDDLYLTQAGDTVVGPTLALETYNDNSSTQCYPTIEFRKSHHDTQGNNTATIDNENLGDIRWYGVNSGGYKNLMGQMTTIQVGAADSAVNGSRFYMRASKTGVGVGVGNAGAYQLVCDEGYGVGVHTVASNSFSGYFSFVATNGNSGSNFVGLGGNSSAYAIQVQGNGYISGTWSYGSDERIKDNIVTITGSEALTKLNALNPVSFNWAAKYLAAIDNDKQAATFSGFLAAEFETVFPEAVQTSEMDLVKKGAEYRLDASLRDGESIDVENIKGLNSDIVIPYLVSAIKELKSQLDAVTSRVDTLES